MLRGREPPQSYAGFFHRHEGTFHQLRPEFTQSTNDTLAKYKWIKVIHPQLNHAWLSCSSHDES